MPEREPPKTIAKGCYFLLFADWEQRHCELMNHLTNSIQTYHINNWVGGVLTKHAMCVDHRLVDERFSLADQVFPVHTALEIVERDLQRRRELIKEGFDLRV